MIQIDGWYRKRIGKRRKHVKGWATYQSHFNGIHLRDYAKEPAICITMDEGEGNDRERLSILFSPDDARLLAHELITWANEIDGA